MLLKFTRKIKKARRFPELEEAIEMKLVFGDMRKGKFSTRDEERCVTAKGCRLYLYEALFAVRLK